MMDEATARAHSCERKIRFSSRKQARKERRRILLLHPDRKTLEVYPCRHCRGYHLGKGYWQGYTRADQEATQNLIQPHQWAS